MSDKKKEEVVTENKELNTLIDAIKAYHATFDNNEDPQVRLAVLENTMNAVIAITGVGLQVTAPQIGFQDMRPKKEEANETKS